MGARLPLRRRPLDLYRRMFGHDVVRTWLRYARPDRSDCAMRGDIREATRWPPADVERRAPQRPGGLAQLPARPVRALGVRQDHPARRQRSYRSRSEEQTSELQSLMRISYAVFCLKKKTPD